jgi:hypothetical protein
MRISAAPRRPTLSQAGGVGRENSYLTTDSASSISRKQHPEWSTRSALFVGNDVGEVHDPQRPGGNVSLSLSC